MIALKVRINLSLPPQLPPDNPRPRHNPSNLVRHSPRTLRTSNLLRQTTFTTLFHAVALPQKTNILRVHHNTNTHLPADNKHPRITRLLPAIYLSPFLHRFPSSSSIYWHFTSRPTKPLFCHRRYRPWSLDRSLSHRLGNSSLYTGLYAVCSSALGIRFKSLYFGRVCNTVRILCRRFLSSVDGDG